MSEDTRKHRTFIQNVLVKTLLLFIIVNLMFVSLPVEKWIGSVSLYNQIFPGRWRLPWSENPAAAYNVSTNNLDALFLSHEVAGSSSTGDEFRVFLFGDSSVWGFLLHKEETLSGKLNASKMKTPNGQTIRVYNLGYPTISLTKDLLLMKKALAYRPDLIVWLVTLEAFPKEKQVFTPLVQVNDEQVKSLIRTYNLDLDENDEGFEDETFFDQTIIGSKRDIADLIRLQVYGVMWSGTGIDLDIPETYTPLQTDYEVDDSFYGFSPPELEEGDLSLDVLEAGVKLAGEIPILIVNEPIFISSGENSDIRYNFFYPRWAYDDYRGILEKLSQAKGWNFVDYWDQIPPEAFTNTAIHMDSSGTAKFARMIGEAILDLLENDMD